MKTNYIRLLAVCGLALSLGACGGGPKAEVATIADAIEWNYDSASAAREGSLLRLEDVIVSANYGNNCLTVSEYKMTPAGGYTDIQAIEVVTKTATTFDWKDIVSVEGTVKTIDGRVTLADATVEWGTGGEAKCKGKGSIIYHQVDNRMVWDAIATRELSSRWCEINVQLASQPVAKANEASSFYVVFPGENMNLEDEGNFAPIEVIIPTNLGEQKATALNAFFEEDGWVVGAGVQLFAQFYYQNSMKLNVPFLTFEKGQSFTKFLDNYYTKWGDENTPGTAAFRVLDFLDMKLPDLQNENAQSYVINLLMIENNAVIINANPSSSNNIDALYEGLVASMDAFITLPDVKDWELIGKGEDSNTGEPLATYAQSMVNPEDPEGEPLLRALIQLSLSDGGYVTIYIESVDLNPGGIVMTDARANELSPGSNAQDIINGYLKSHLVSHVGIYGFMGLDEEGLKAWSSKVPSFTTAGGANYSKSLLIYSQWDSYNGTGGYVYTYLMLHCLEKAQGELTEEEITAAGNAYVTSVTEAGFVPATLSEKVLGEAIEGLWSAASNEFIVLQAKPAAESTPASVVVNLMYIHPDVAAKQITIA